MLLRPVITSIRRTSKLVNCMSNDSQRRCIHCGSHHYTTNIRMSQRTPILPAGVPRRSVATTNILNQHPVLSGASLKESFLRSLETRLQEELDEGDVDTPSEQISLSTLREAWSQLPFYEKLMYIEEQPPDDVFDKESQCEITSVPDIETVLRQSNEHLLDPLSASSFDDGKPEFHTVLLTKYQLFLWKKLKAKPEKYSMRAYLGSVNKIWNSWSEDDKFENVKQIAHQWQSLSEASQKEEFTTLIVGEQSLKEELEMIKACCNLFSLEEEKLAWAFRKLGMPQTVPIPIAMYLTATARRDGSSGNGPIRYEHPELAEKYEKEILEWVEQMKTHENVNVRKYFKLRRMRTIPIEQKMQNFPQLSIAQKKAVYKQLGKPELVSSAYVLYRKQQKGRLCSGSEGRSEDSRQWLELSDTEKLVYVEEYAKMVDNYYLEVAEWESQMREHHTEEVRNHFHIPPHYSAAKSPLEAFLRTSIETASAAEPWFIELLSEEWKLKTEEEKEPYIKLHLESRKKWHLYKYDWEEKKKVQSILEKLKQGLTSKNKKKDIVKRDDDTTTVTQWVFELDQ